MVINSFIYQIGVFTTYNSYGAECIRAREKWQHYKKIVMI